MKTAALVIIKPEGLYRSIVGEVLNKFAETGLELIALRLVEVSREQAKEHYKQLQGKPFFNGVVNHMMGKYHEGARALVLSRARCAAAVHRSKQSGQTRNHVKLHG